MGDLADTAGRGPATRYAVRILQDLNVERENHHVLWLKYSYPLRSLLLEVERRLVAAGIVDPGSIFFLQITEALDALDGVEQGDLRQLADQRRRAYRHEAKLEETDPATLIDEDDYY